MKCTNAMFGQKKADLTGLTRNEVLQLFRTTIDIKRGDIASMGQLANATRSGTGKGEILMKNGAFAVNGEKKRDPSESVSNVLLPGLPDLTLICWGKRDYNIVRWI
uniref:ABC transporter ATP-binding protein n=2 Tax=Caenorhabditis tropicalis TaxID=1561998 RepID=A0A1I7TDZ3_9PELO